MTFIEVSLDTPVAPAFLEEILDERPTGWLRPFLQLATVHVTGRRAPHGPWYRLGRAVQCGGGATASRLVWRPNAGDGVFERFTGEITVEPQPAGARLTVRGIVVGGRPDADREALEALARLIVAASTEVPGEHVGAPAAAQTDIG